jgi:hypothetical protein
MAVLNTQGAHSHQLTDQNGTAVIETSFSDRTETAMIDSAGVMKRSHPANSSSLYHDTLQQKVRQPVKNNIPKSNDHDHIKGLVKLRNVPGFEKENISIGEMDDGSSQVFSRDSNGTMHMTGFVSQWPDMPSVAGNWAISGSTGDRIAVFKVKQLLSFDHCHCHEKS